MNIFVIFFKNWQNVIGSKRRFRISTSLYKRQKKDNKLLSILTCSHHVFLILSKELPLSLWCSLILSHPHTLSLSLSLSVSLSLSLSLAASLSHTTKAKRQKMFFLDQNEVCFKTSFHLIRGDTFFILWLLWFRQQAWVEQRGTMESSLRSTSYVSHLYQKILNNAGTCLFERCYLGR